MKVLLIVEPTPFNYVSGYANRFKEMLKCLRTAGDEVEVVVTDPLPSAPDAFEGFPIHTFRGVPFPFYKGIAVSFDLRGRLAAIVRSFRPDVIHVSSPSAIMLPAILWARHFDIPLVISYHTDLIGYTRSYLPWPGMDQLAAACVRRLHRAADLVLVTSPQLAASQQALGVDRLDVWRKGIDTEVFAPTHADAGVRAWLSQGHADRQLLLYVGRLGVEKKIHRLKECLIANPSACLAVVGAGPAEEVLRREFVGLPVFFTGQTQGHLLSQIYASADIFVMPSDTETLGFVVLEAMASGLPVVGAKAGGLLDLIAHGQTGYLAEDTDTFSQYVRELIADPMLRQQMGRQARANTLQWSWYNATNDLRNIQYRKAIALHRSRDDQGNHVRDIAEAICQHFESG